MDKEYLRVQEKPEPGQARFWMKWWQNIIKERRRGVEVFLKIETVEPFSL
jgi:hypothetical protein